MEKDYIMTLGIIEVLESCKLLKKFGQKLLKKFVVSHWSPNTSNAQVKLKIKRKQQC